MEEAIRGQRITEKFFSKRQGKHSGSLAPEQGQAVSLSDIDLPATLRNAQLRLKRYRPRRQGAVLFVVDASRSQGAKERLAFAKGAVMAMLERAYSERERVGMILFGNRKADLVLPYTKSVDIAAKKVEDLKAKGNTPLSMGMRLAIKTIEMDSRKYPDAIHTIVLLTDGKSNYDEAEGKPLDLALETAGEIKRRQMHLLVVDTENSIFGMGLAKMIADAADGWYVSLST